jgi:hypothetical protein
MNIDAYRGRAGRMLLVLAVAGVWIAVGVRFFVEFGGEPPSSSTGVAAAESQVDVVLRPRMRFVGDFRDPFSKDEAVIDTPDDEGSGVDGRDNWFPNRPSKPLPTLWLRGVVGSTAIIESEQNGPVLLTEGGVVDGATIEIVERDHVVMEFDGRYHTIILTRDERTARNAGPTYPHTQSEMP